MPNDRDDCGRISETTMSDGISHTILAPIVAATGTVVASRQGYPLLQVLLQYHQASGPEG